MAAKTPYTNQKADEKFLRKQWTRIIFIVKDLTNTPAEPKLNCIQFETTNDHLKELNQEFTWLNHSPRIMTVNKSKPRKEVKPNETKTHVAIGPSRDGFQRLRFFRRQATTQAQ